MKLSDEILSFVFVALRIRCAKSIDERYKFRCHGARKRSGNNVRDATLLASVCLCVAEQGDHPGAKFTALLRL